MVDCCKDRLYISSVASAADDVVVFCYVRNDSKISKFPKRGANLEKTISFQEKTFFHGRNIIYCRDFY